MRRSTRRNTNYEKAINMDIQTSPYHYNVRIYYEDTDHTGVVYHPNFLKYFERARETVLGIENLDLLWKTYGLGFAVYKAELTYFDGVGFGEMLTIHTRYDLESDYRVNWHQEAWKAGVGKPAVTANFQHVCLDRAKQLQPIPFHHADAATNTWRLP